MEEINQEKKTQIQNILNQNILKESGQETKYFWINANPDKWDMLEKNVETYEKTGPLNNAKIGNLVVGYKTNGTGSAKEQVGLSCIVSIFFVSKISEGEVTITKLNNLSTPFLQLKKVNDNSITKNILPRNAAKEISEEQFVEIISMMIQYGVLQLRDFQTAINNIPSLIGGSGSKGSNNHPLNLILYGPPGTGKTYNTLFHALKIIKGEGAIKGKSYDDLKPEFDRLVTRGHVVFTTFHQSMSYEDFIEGIKPIPVDDKIEAIHENSDKNATSIAQFGNGKTTIENLSRMKYEVRGGIFKQICEKASHVHKITHKLILKDVIDYFCFDVEKYGSDIEVYRGKSKKFRTSIDANKNIYKSGEYKSIGLTAQDEYQSISLTMIRDYYSKYTNNQIHDYKDIKSPKTNSKFGNAELCYGLLQEIKKFADNKYKNEYEGNEIDATIKNNYVLIIDEINRGNVSQIFGELITLIEESKRTGDGQKEAMTAILPYSSAQKGKPVYFGVPNNLYIIGTMNTADRSVEALDTALRRRFSFEEMMPDPELLKDKEVCGVNLSDLLTTINNRIVVLKDREHQIGHSYFMGVETESDLEKVFKDKIIPLLQEYFYGDYKKIYYVLGPGFVENSFSGKKTDEIQKVLFPFVDHNDRDDLDISEERFEIRPFDDIKKDNKVVIKAAVHKLIGIYDYQWEKNNYNGKKYKKGDGKEIDTKYVAEREFGGEDINFVEEINQVQPKPGDNGQGDKQI